jgi:hypothetical protein
VKTWPVAARRLPARALCMSLAFCTAVANAQVKLAEQQTPPPPETPYPAAGQQMPRPPGQPSPPPRGERRDGAGWVPWAIVGAGAAILATRMFQQRAYADDNSLAANGPRFPDSFTVGTFAVQGYFKDGWPFVLDFLPQPDSCTVLEISLHQKVMYALLLDRDGRSGRRLVQAKLPPGIAERPQSALYVVRSERPACAAQTGASHDPSPVEVYGIGGGPRAVGSVAIDQLRFEPAAPQLPQEQVQIGYRAKSGFNHASVEILRFHQEQPGRIDVQRVRARRVDGLAPGSVNADSWDGKLDGGQRSLGVHRLQVRAWFTENDRSWVGAISPASVRVNN